MLNNEENFSDRKVLIGLSGGINSMALLCHLANHASYNRPKELHLFYAHFEEHSPDTLGFVLAGVEYAKKIFDNVVYTQTNNSVLQFFREQKMIPHPIIAPCTRLLKILPMAEYMVKNNIDVDLVGYVKEEARRIANMHKKNPNTINTKAFPIKGMTNEWCFEIVKKEIGWYPKIYDLRDNKGKRVFTHNNCLPCKNMQTKDFEKVKTHFPEYYAKAMELSQELKKHWGRDKDEGIKMYLEFGREDYEVGGKEQSCEVCAESSVFELASYKEENNKH